MSNLKSKGKVLVAMSGGVDSSVAAALLVEQGYEVVGATMQVWDYSSCDVDEGQGTCCSSLDVDDARSVADKLGIPFYVLNCEAKFKNKVIDPFIQSYLAGRTPLPCVDCNTYLKFDHLILKMKELGCDYLATGHYAQILPGLRGEPSIQTSEDSWKDQTYFLFTLNPEILGKLLFPVGHLTKPEVRKIAEDRGLVVAKKKDSTGICFVGSQGYGQFIESQLGPEIGTKFKGVFRRYPQGQVMGEHKGTHLFTIGQSRGFGLDHHEKLFVVKIDVESKTVWLGEEKDLYSTEVLVEDPHFLHAVADEETLSVKIRYAHKGSEARIVREGKTIKVIFKEPQRAVTPGQAAVFYRDRQLLGGGWIR